MLSGSITKGILTIAIPIMVMNVLQSLFNLVEMTVLKNYGTDEMAVGAIGASGTLISLITGLVIGIASGSNVVIAKHIGRGDEAGVRRAVGTALFLAVLGGVLLSAIGILGADLFLTWMNCPATLFDRAVTYFRMYFGGVPVLMVYNYIAAILRSSGDTKRPMVFLTIGGLTKLVLTYVFVAGFGMSIEGVGFATWISWAVIATLGFLALSRNKSVVKFEWKHFRPYKAEILEILYIGVPAGLQQALYSVANVIITATVNSFGPSATTGVSIANIFDGILYQISIAPALAVMPYVSQNIGAGNLDRARKSVRRGILITCLLGGSIGALSAIFSGPLSSIMSSSPEVIAYSQQKMMLISATYFICGINEIMGAAMRGLQKPIIPTISTLLFMCAIRFVWVFLIFPLVPNLTFLYLIWPIGWVISIIFILCFYMPTIGALKRKLQPKQTEAAASCES
jgi:putative MATE family efflux protein